MNLVKIHYQDQAATRLITDTLTGFWDDIRTEPVFLCIGSDRHILDCFGPLTGTLLKTYIPEAAVLGTLDQPLHARNMIQGIAALERTHKGRTVIAIDASVGNEDEIGLLQVRSGSLMPGRALAKNLPPVGDYAITGVVEIRANKRGTRNKHFGLGLVYRMTQVLSRSIADFYHNKYTGN